MIHHCLYVSHTVLMNREYFLSMYIIDTMNKLFVILCQSSTLVFLLYYN